jgi:hypothetical protein
MLQLPRLKGRKPSVVVGVAERFKAPGCGPGERGFESLRSPHSTITVALDICAQYCAQGSGAAVLGSITAGGTEKERSTVDTSIKQTVDALLLQRNTNELLILCQTDERYWRALRLYLYETDENLRWPAIEAIAELMGRWCNEGGTEKVREYIRRLLWLLNDESGGIGWSAPEAIAEMCVRVPELLEPYGHIMISYVLKGQDLLNGSLWAIGRLGKQIKEVLCAYQEKVLAAFDKDDSETLALAAWAMGESEFAPAVPHLKMLKDRKEIVQIYIDGHFQEKSLGNWANEAIAKICR